MLCCGQDYSCIEPLVRGRCDVAALSKHGDGATALLLGGGQVRTLQSILQLILQFIRFNSN